MVTFSSQPQCANMVVSDYQQAQCMHAAGHINSVNVFLKVSLDINVFKLLLLLLSFDNIDDIRRNGFDPVCSKYFTSVQID